MTARTPFLLSAGALGCFIACDGGSAEVYAEFSNYLRGTAVKRNPMNGEVWELPDRHRNVWFGENGRVLLTDVEGYDSNADRDRGGRWQRAR